MPSKKVSVIIIDTEEWCSLLKEYLEVPGREIITVSSADEAVKLAKELRHTMSVVVMDRRAFKDLYLKDNRDLILELTSANEHLHIISYSWSHQHFNTLMSYIMSDCVVECQMEKTHPIPTPLYEDERLKNEVTKMMNDYTAIMK